MSASQIKVSLLSLTPGCADLWVVQPSLGAKQPASSCPLHPMNHGRTRTQPHHPLPAPPKVYRCQSHAQGEQWETLLKDEKGEYWWVTRQRHEQEGGKEKQGFSDQAKEAHAVHT